MNRDGLIEALKALAHPLRYRILEVLQDAERNVGEIEELTGIGQPGLSQQLAVLRSAGLVHTRKSAKLVFYRLDPATMGEVRGAIGRFARAADAPKPARAAPGAANFARLS
ncbi:metalloregulator ArsR/SmtB family transcription factor [Altererythrobacter sp. H2]|uniref:ArsR/SmtB family transcription factor n=1 Tax=Altererythrobacter sp. H2 TaxID=3108391 RepID=UPI002B4BFC5D|nr:metalloregulator ArsR/SmtB family transcription factor [Altererythrobacter sp. H2]WRK95031.1 metalloregulator ArsR/SmtB family transcription factor [Altererythrobacter sp. H2]